MSFLVTFNGQFSPFTPPTVQGGIHRVRPLTNTSDVKEFKEIQDEVAHEGTQKKSLQRLDVYKVAKKKYEEQRKRYHARDIMSYPVKTIAQHILATEAKILLAKFGYRHLPVVNDLNFICGMISDRELSSVIENKTCSDIMINRVIVCEEHASINEIAIILLEEKINALPIVNHKHELTGIITLSDILKFVVNSNMLFGRG